MNIKERRRSSWRRRRRRRNRRKRKKKSKQRATRSGPLINISSFSSSSSSSFSSCVTTTTDDGGGADGSAYSIVRAIFTPTCMHTLLFAQAKGIILIRSPLTNTRQRRELLVPAELIDVYISGLNLICIHTYFQRNEEILYVCIRFNSASIYI